MTFTIFLISAMWMLQNATLGRADGSDLLGLSEWTERSLIMFFFVLAASTFAGPLAILAFAGVVGIATGHGQYFLDRKVKYIKPQGTDLVMRLLFGQDPRTRKEFGKLSGAAQTGAINKAMNEYGLKKLYWRNVTGLFVTGLLVGLPAAGLAVYFGEYILGAIFLLTAPVKALAYVLSHKLFKSTEPAEWINGGGRGAITLAVLLITLA